MSPGKIGPPGAHDRCGSKRGRQRLVGSDDGCDPAAPHRQASLDDAPPGHRDDAALEDEGGAGVLVDEGNECGRRLTIFGAGSGRPRLLHAGSPPVRPLLAKARS